jgi:hypothetical protein
MDQKKEAAEPKMHSCIFVNASEVFADHRYLFTEMAERGVDCSWGNNSFSLVPAAWLKIELEKLAKANAALLCGEKYPDSVSEVFELLEKYPAEVYVNLEA